MNKDYCRWCQRPNKNGKLITDIDFSVIDDDFGQPVTYTLVEYCPFCGRKLYEESKHNER